FLAICEEGSFTGAARRCGVSQPSVSNAIRLLEEELGGSLFRRAPRGAQLSPLGAAMRPYLQKINGCAENARPKAAAFCAADPTSTHRDNGEHHAHDSLRYGGRNRHYWSVPGGSLA